MVLTTKLECKFKCDICGKIEVETYGDDRGYDEYSKPPKEWFNLHLSAIIESNSDEFSTYRRSVWCCSKNCVEKALKEYNADTFEDFVVKT